MDSSDQFAFITKGNPCAIEARRWRKGRKRLEPLATGSTEEVAGQTMTASTAIRKQPVQDMFKHTTSRPAITIKHVQYL
jgi:hypothetical protein